jgi:hypothetical protein
VDSYFRDSPNILRQDQSMRALAWTFYWIGDLISRTIMRFGYGYSIYNRVMNWSLSLDKDESVWKKVKSELPWKK